MKLRMFFPLAVAASVLGSYADAGTTTIRVKWDGRYVPGITSISPLGRKTEAVENRTGGDTNSVRRSPGRTSMPLLYLRRPRTAAQEFEKWAAKVWTYANGPGTEISLADYRKDVVLEVTDAGGKVTAAYHVYRCWPAEYTPLADATSESPAGFEILGLACEGFDRDNSIK